jgi:predicted helicase
MQNFKEILAHFQKDSFSERQKGTRFEQLMQRYLHTDPQYSHLFSNVWLWNEFPGRHSLGGKDTGIDIVCETHSNEYWAVQCKCYDAKAIIDKHSVDSFLSTSGRSFQFDDDISHRFSQRLWISTTNKWNNQATEAILNQNPPVTRLNLTNLEESPVDWGKIYAGHSGKLALKPKKELFRHQERALENAHAHFKDFDRGKLIMACGTGKTFTSLKIAEHETSGKGYILFLVPSIALLGQTLRAWSADALDPINAVCICSDPKVSKKNDSDGISVIDIALPASTDVNNIIRQFDFIEPSNQKEGMTVVFSTYQSIDVIAEVQKKTGEKPFDLIICDEAHRTTGVTLSGNDESAFVKVHDNEFIKAKKRLYMTATPRLFDDNAKSKAAQFDAVLCSMDDSELYGEEIDRLGFGEAVEKDLLTDYKVLILTLNDADVPKAIRHILENDKTEIKTDDLTKIVGTINAMAKQFIGDEGKTKESDPLPMRSAVAFCQSIAVSKKIADTYNAVTDSYIESLPEDKKKDMISIEAKHIDGTFSAPKREEMLNWLRHHDNKNECRILTNVRVLSEGVDVPSLDAVLFLSARNSQVDVVQSVGRVMRKAPNKKYGYIIIPVVVPSDVEPEKALDDNERYKVVWTVLNALRAHDDRFNATVNKIELNKKKPQQILVGRPDIQFDQDDNPLQIIEDSDEHAQSQAIRNQLALDFEELKGVVFARMVNKVGDRRYWEQWAKSVAEIAQRHVARITKLVNTERKYKEAFQKYLNGLQENINPNLSQEDAIEMLSQHIITAPVFDALFEDYSFARNNPISHSIQRILDILEDQSIEKEHEPLERFYESVRKRAEGIDNAEGKQRIILELYEKYFKTALPKMVEKLGIVYTPVEVVDFTIHSVNDVLLKEFGRSISDENVHILDPFTGTGTFFSRLIQSGLIEKKDISRKYKCELHANEIVLLAYYIAAVNIENAYHDFLGEDSEYEPFDGIVLTDTFQLGETDDSKKLFSEMFPQNSARVERQKKAPVRVIIGNPPYSIGQKSANDNAQNQKYDKLDARIAATYAALSSAGLNKSLYDAYIKAFRWSADRLDPKNGGVIAFVSNGAWLDGNSTDGFRLALEQEFSSIWVFNTRGNARTQGEQRRKEAGNVFGGGSRTPISITLLVKNPNAKTDKATIHYHDIGDYLNREEKLSIVKKFKSIGNKQMTWKTLQPNEHGDWLKQRNEIFETFIPMAPEQKLDATSQSFFLINGPGVATGRDSWVYNFSKDKLESNMWRMIDTYISELNLIREEKIHESKKIQDLLTTDSSKISWTVNLKKDIEKGVLHAFKKDEIAKASYRPFSTQFYYSDKPFIERQGISKIISPKKDLKNVVIGISSKGSNKGLGIIITDKYLDYHLAGDTQCFPLFYYEEREKNSPSLFDAAGESKYIRRDGVSDFILDRAKKVYGKNVGKEDIFYYVYGILHSPDYRTAFANDLKKMLPRIPLVEDVRDFWKFSKAGRKLAELHINYEGVPPYEGVEVSGDEFRFLSSCKRCVSPRKGNET